MSGAKRVNGDLMGIPLLPLLCLLLPFLTLSFCFQRCNDLFVISIEYRVYIMHPMPKWNFPHIMIIDQPLVKCIAIYISCMIGPWSISHAARLRLECASFFCIINNSNININVPNSITTRWLDVSHLKCSKHIITFKDSIVDGKIRDVADMLRELLVIPTGRRVVEDTDAPSVSILQFHRRRTKIRIIVEQCDC